MRREFLGFLVLALSWPACWAEQIVIGDDGSVSGRFGLAASEAKAIALNFGLPPVSPVQRRHEQDVFRTEWISNGIRYTQTVLITALGAGNANAATTAAKLPVLLVNIEGENTNTSYTEASAELALSVDGNRRELELKDGLIWSVQGEARAALGALEIPESGIKLSRGDVLKFSGNMPPSLKGAMTIKIPLEHADEQQPGDRLRDLDFQEELRQALKPKPAGPGKEHWALTFAPHPHSKAANSALTGAAAR
jgi:hypothetical protein